MTKDLIEYLFITNEDKEMSMKDISEKVTLSNFDCS